jgi:hypothetical protein
MDRILHLERLDARRQRVTYAAALAALPDAAFVVHGGAACLVRGGCLWPWRPEGYGAAVALPADEVVAVLTPRSTVNTLAAGFAVQMDESSNS